MKAYRLILGWACLLGGIGVILGAMGAHALAERLGDLISSFETGVRYQIYHSFLLLFLGWWVYQNPSKLFPKIIAIIITVGVICFSGSIYLLCLTDAKVGLITPLGGSLLIFAWISLALHILFAKITRKNETV